MLVPEESPLIRNRITQSVELAALQKTGWYVPHWAWRSWDRRWQWWGGLRQEKKVGDHFIGSKICENFEHTESRLRQSIEQGRR